MSSVSLRAWNLCTLVVALSLLPGCGGGGGNRLATVPVEGKVNLDGQPFGPGMIEFLPVSKDGGKTPLRSALGKVDGSGMFVMGSYDETDGVVPGEYHIRITSGSDDPSMPGPEVPVDSEAVQIPNSGKKDLVIELKKSKRAVGGLLTPNLESGASTDL